MDWNRLPDLGAIALLTCAFATVARRSHTHVSGLWLTGWSMIVLHFMALIFAPAPGTFRTLAVIISYASLSWAGVLFMWASTPYRKELSSRCMLIAILGTNTLYITLITTIPTASWAILPTAGMFCVLPLAITILALRRINHLLRWTVVLLYADLGVLLLTFYQPSSNAPDLALNALLFTVYLGCSIHFWYGYRRATSGAFIAIAGFLLWAAAFVLAPALRIYLPAVHVESEVWNLPEYVAAVGMILLVLEDEIEHNKHLALHDELTGLPNRRLFYDRLACTLERARRAGTQAALLLIDLDNFKQVNDTAGHHVGDLLLKQIGELFAGRLRASDTIARTGGDEFSVLLGEPITRREAEGVCNALMAILAEPVDLGSCAILVGASVGIAVFPDDATTGDSLCVAADRLMYTHKHASRGGELPHPSRPRLEGSQTVKARGAILLRQGS